MSKPELERKEIRKTLYEIFASYRSCKVLLDREFVPHGEKPKPKPGYANAMDPDLIHVQRVFPQGPAGFTTPSMLSAEERGWERFVEWVDRKVRRLPEYQRKIIRLRFLGKDPLPRDYEVYGKLYQEKWCVSKRNFDREKARALVTLSKSLDASHDAGFQE